MCIEHNNTKVNGIWRAMFVKPRLWFCSRCGMVYLDPEELKWMPYVQTWMNKWKHKMKEVTVDYTLELFSRYVEDGLKFVNKKCEQAISQVKAYFTHLCVFVYVHVFCVYVCVHMHFCIYACMHA